MARGWESKAVESQIETSESKRGESARKQLTPEMAAAQRKIETLRLARTNLQARIKASQNPRHRALLERALTDLNAQLANLGRPEGANKSE